LDLFQQLAAELAITIANRDVWLAIGLALVLGVGCLLFGIWVTRRVGLLPSDAPAGEIVGVGLSSGLIVLAAGWAAIWSGGRSSFAPVAVGFAISLALMVIQRSPRPSAVEADTGKVDAEAAPSSRNRGSMALTVLAGCAFIVAVALLYGSTMARSPRDGLQPVERTDVAYYAVLSEGLATSGTEDNTFTSGFSDLPGVAAQAWYHWGELWLTSAVIAIFGTAPLAARYLVVLPLLLLAAAALTGTLVRRMGGTSSRAAFLFGFVVCLVLAPIPLIAGPFFSVGEGGLIFGITVYGLAAVAVLLALYLLAVLDTRRTTWPLATLAGCAIALIFPAHIVVALLGLVGVATVWAIRIGRSLLSTGRPSSVSPIWRRTIVVTTIALGSAVAWGQLTGHGLGSGAPLATVSSFNPSWRDSVAIVFLGAGLLLGIPLAWLLARRDAPALGDVYLGTIVILIAGAFVWGWRLATFNMFHFFFAGIAVFATPIGAVAVWRLWLRIRTGRRPMLAIVVILIGLLQLELGLVLGLTRLRGQSPDYDPIPVSVLDAIEQLPADAKLAYACREFEEISFVNSKLLGIDAHTGRRVVPMCFEADVNGPLLGVQPSRDRPDAGFAFAPQQILYPDSAAHPSADAVSAFLKANGIDYIYADKGHPNTLVADAVPIVTTGDAQVLRIP
jgi:hypothetical protein